MIKYVILCFGSRINPIRKWVNKLSPDGKLFLETSIKNALEFDILVDAENYVKQIESVHNVTHNFDNDLTFKIIRI